METAVNSEKKENNSSRNPLGTVPVKSLIWKFAIPSIIAMLVTSIYNIVDQFFIGQCVGSLGNAATSIFYPLTVGCISVSLLCGIGGASAFNLAMGMRKTKEAKYYVGNAIVIMILVSAAIMVVTLVFTEPLMMLFGSSDEILPYALPYARVCAIGFPVLVLQGGGTQLVRADGRPMASMTVNLLGAAINVILDALFVFVLGWGMAGAAAATVIGQAVSAVLLIWYLVHFKTLKLDKEAFRLKASAAGRLLKLGMANFFTQIAIMVVIILVNKSLNYYGEQSIYGSATAVAITGIAAKCMQLVLSVVIGFSQGMQPITSYNYGAARYDRVKEAYLRTIRRAAVVPIIAWALFQIFPTQIIGFFGDGDALYFEFGARYMHIAYAVLFTYFLQPITGNFFSSIGKPQRGILISLTRQIFFFLPLLFILPLFLGVDGILWGTSIADAAAFVVCAIIAARELRRPEYRMQPPNHEKV